MEGGGGGGGLRGVILSRTLTPYAHPLDPRMFKMMNKCKLMKPKKDPRIGPQLLVEIIFEFDRGGWGVGVARLTDTLQTYIFIR